MVNEEVSLRDFISVHIDGLKNSIKALELRFMKIESASEENTNWRIKWSGLAAFLIIISTLVNVFVTIFTFLK